VLGHLARHHLRDLWQREMTVRTDGEITIFDIGCGSGSMAARFASLGYCGNYTGVDIGDRFPHPDPSSPFNVRFIRDDAHRAVPASAVDLLLSISALEHIGHDVQLLLRVGQHVKSGSRIGRFCSRFGHFPLLHRLLCYYFAARVSAPRSHDRVALLCATDCEWNE